MAAIGTTPCSACESACCQRLAIQVNLVDIARIVRTLDIPAYDLLARYVDEDPKELPYVFWIRKQPVTLALLPNGAAVCGCPFVISVGGHARCGIYDIRPGTCRVYPFSRQAGKISHKRGALCPGRFKPDEVETRRINEEIDRYQEEWCIHARFCDEWNADPPRYPSFDKLLDFVNDIVESGEV